MAPALQDGNEEYNVKLHAGDMVMVPQVTARIAVLGYVTSPGYFSVPDGQRLRLADALGLAKGVDNKRAGVSAVAVIRNEDDGRQERNIYDIKKYLKTGDPRHNPEVHPGDIVYVPETDKPNWDWIYQGMQALGTLLGPVKIR